MSDSRGFKKTIERVVQDGFCSGCGACAGIVGKDLARMNISKSGFLRPEFNEGGNRDLWAKATVACTGIGMAHSHSDSTPIHELWGPVRFVGTAHAKDGEVSRLGSSGGVVSALAIHLIESGKVDFVAQVAVSDSDPLSNVVQMSRTRRDVLRAAGSRYAPAAPLARIDEFLATGRRFAFIGKPCDVAALRALSRVDERVRRQIPFMISFMCAGVPSIRGTHALLDAMGVDKEEVVQFRYRGDGWPGMARAVTRDGSVSEMDYNTSWGSILNRYLQFRCKICPDGTGEFADVVCADAWYGENGYPDFAERDGRSLLIARTGAGVSLLDDAATEGAIVVSSLKIDEISRMQPYQVNRKRTVLARLIGTAFRRTRVPRFRRLGLLRASIGASPLEFLRSIWGTFKRAVGESN
jgi:coenzyme F420 hydrogenase subunit beta